MYNQVNDVEVLREISRKLEIEDETIDGLRKLLIEYSRTRD